MRYNFRFVKFHGCGNDFIIKDELDSKPTSDKDRGKLATLLCDRHFQIGGDGILFVERSGEADGSMRLFEPDGKEADMCGNGIKCIAAYLCDKFGKDAVDILTRDGVKHVTRVRGQYRVDMGFVRTTRADLGHYLSDSGKPGDSLMNIEVEAGRRILRCSLVNSGEPHLVVKSKSVDAEDVCTIGDNLKRNRSRFPKGININFVEPVGPHKIRVRTYERGVYYETLACGTGATASAAVALMKSWVKPGPVKVRVPGGEITIEMDNIGRAFMTGPAIRVFSGQLEVEV